MLDIDVITRAMAYVAATSTSRGADTACEGVSDAFTGAELLAGILRIQVAPLAAILSAHAFPMAVENAGACRGAVLVNERGRAAVVVDVGKVVEPAGRVYALTETSPDWWASGYWLRDVVPTMSP
jgi:hypothetical protein